MATLSNIAKHNGSLSKTTKRSRSGRVFYAWLFWFTRPITSSSLTNIAKHNGALTAIPKH